MALLRKAARAPLEKARTLEILSMSRGAQLWIVLVSIAVILPGATSGDDTTGPWRSIPLIQDGKVAPGWSHIGWGGLVVDGDSLRTECDQRGMGLLVYAKERLGNCQIRVVFRSKDARSNSGVYVRIDDGILDWLGKESVAVQRNKEGKLSPEMLQKLKDASEREEGVWYAVHHGYEVQIADGADAAHRTGAIYSLTRASAIPPQTAVQWRTMVITLRGSQIAVAIDGQEASQFESSNSDVPPRAQWYEPKREAKRPEVGYIGLQNHDPGDIVYFKEISVRPL